MSTSIPIDVSKIGKFNYKAKELDAFIDYIDNLLSDWSGRLELEHKFQLHDSLDQRHNQLLEVIKQEYESGNNTDVVKGFFYIYTEYKNSKITGRKILVYNKDHVFPIIVENKHFNKIWRSYSNTFHNYIINRLNIEDWNRENMYGISLAKFILGLEHIPRDRRTAESLL